MSQLKTIKLGQLTELISSGATPLGGEKTYLSQGPIVFLRSQNVRMGFLDLSEVAYISEEADQALRRTRVKHGDVLLNITGASIGRVASFNLRGTRANVNQHVCVIRPIAGQLDSQYLAQYLATPQFQAKIDQLQSGGTRQALTFSKIADFDIPLLSLPEQKSIAATLEKADSIRRKRKAVIKIADEFLRATFLEMFGDPVTNTRRMSQGCLGDLLERIESGVSPVCLDRPAADNEWGVLKLGGVTRCFYDENENKALPEGIVPNLQLEIKEGDILFTRKNTYDLVAACVYVEKTRSKLMIPDLVFRLKIRPNAPILPSYLWAVMTHPGKRREIQKLANGAAGSMPNISKTRLQTVLLPVPNRSQQQNFDEVYSYVRRLKTSFQNLYVDSLNLFNSLTQRAFKGEL